MSEARRKFLHVLEKAAFLRMKREGKLCPREQSLLYDRVQKVYLFDLGANPDPIRLAKMVRDLAGQRLQEQAMRFRENPAGVEETGIAMVQIQGLQGFGLNVDSTQTDWATAVESEHCLHEGTHYDEVLGAWHAVSLLDLGAWPVEKLVRAELAEVRQAATGKRRGGTGNP